MPVPDVLLKASSGKSGDMCPFAGHAHEAVGGGRKITEEFASDPHSSQMSGETVKPACKVAWSELSVVSREMVVGSLQTAPNYPSDVCPGKGSQKNPGRR